jgi:hypothetical protein
MIRYSINRSGIRAVTPDPLLLLTLVVITLASLGVFLIAVYRETHHRRELRLADWASRAGMKPIDPLLFQPESLLLPPASVRVRVEGGFFDVRTTLMAVQTIDQTGTPQRWNLAVRKLAGVTGAIGLRPVHAERALTDLYQLAPAAHQGSGKRFTVVGEDLSATRRLAEGSIAALLPADIGLVRVGPYLVLDFSSRPFDEIEFNRVRSVLDQVASTT